MNPGAATERLFFALRPDAAAAAGMHELAVQLCATHGLRARPLAIERLHVTLCFLGDHAGVSEQQITAADAAGKSLRRGPFELVFDHVESFGRKRGAAPVVLGAKGDSTPLRELHHMLTAQVATSGLFQLDTRPFKPHVTLLYAEKFIDEQPVPPLSWTAAEVLLIRSHIGRGRHDVLGRYRLA